MKTSVCVVGGALLLAGCSAGNAATPPSGTLPPGTAVVSVTGATVGSTYSVRCESIDWMTRIETPGLSAMLSRAGALSTEFVRLYDVAGFTGSYERGRQGDAKVTMAGATYQISGTAMGFNTAQPTQLKAETFTLTVSC